MIGKIVKLFELQDQENARWLSMEGLRGFAVILVFFVHYSTLIEPYVGVNKNSLLWLRAIREIGNSGVDLFFVLSGFLIYKACIHRPLNLSSYAFRRIERIYPTFIAVLIIYLALMLLFPETSRLPITVHDTIIYIVSNILLLPGIFDITPIITVSWSLSYEAFYYISVPVFVILLSMKKWSAINRTFFLLCIFVLMIILMMVNIPLHFRLSMFLGGAVLYELTYQIFPYKGLHKTNNYLDATVVVLLILGLICFTLLGHSRWLVANTALDMLPSYSKFIILNFIFVLLTYRCLFSNGFACSIFSWSPLRWLGNMSYSYYLIHGLGLHLFFMVLSKFWLYPSVDPAKYIYFFVPAFLTSVIASIPVYLLVERPFSLRR